MRTIALLVFACLAAAPVAAGTGKDTIPGYDPKGDVGITPDDTGKPANVMVNNKGGATSPLIRVVGSVYQLKTNGTAAEQGGDVDRYNCEDGTIGRSGCQAASTTKKNKQDEVLRPVVTSPDLKKGGGLPEISQGLGSLGLGASGLRTGNIPTPANRSQAYIASLDAEHTILGPTGQPLTDGIPVSGEKRLALIQGEIERHPEDPTLPAYAVQVLNHAGDRENAYRVAQSALQTHPENKDLQEFVTAYKRTETASSTVKTRAKELMATLRGDAGDAPPPGAALASRPELASALAFPALGAMGGAAAPRALTPAALAALNRQDSGLRLADPLVQNAVGRIMVRDLPAAKTLLDRRLEQNPSDEPALRFRALTLRQMGKYEPSSHDAKAALTLAPWDMRARRLLIDDEVDLGHADQALAEADAALRDTPNSAEIYAARSNAYAALGNREAQLADLKQAAALDSQFDQLYQQALASPAAHASKRPHSMTVWLGAVGTALIFFSFVLFRKRGDSSVRLAMRADDHALLARGARPDAAPAGFRIVRTLGQGGMGVVYEAVDLGLQRTVALKKLRSEIADSPRERSRFLKEARTVAGLKHPNIVEIHAIHEDAEGLFLVFEKVNGETLHERLGRGALTPAEAVAYLRQVAKALDCAHSSGVVHQDLKPANVMVAGDVAKVMDFGIARRVQETMSTISRVEVAGTPAYMAPEQELGGVVGPAADIFALGACSYELLTGRTPFPSGGMMMKSQKMYRPASEVNPSLTAAADNAISRALEPEPAARWPSASSFVEALARSLS